MAIGRIPEPGSGIQESIIAAKGDLISGTANDVPAILTVGADGTTLVADSAEATGLKWATPAGGGVDPILVDATSGIYQYPLLVTGNPGDNANATVGRTCYTSIYLPTCTLDRIGIRRGVVTGTYTVRLGIYNNTTANKPGTVLLDAGNVTVVAATANYEITISQSITEGWYWLAANAQVEVAPGNCGLLSTGTASNRLVSVAGWGGLGQQNMTGYDQTGVTTAFSTAVPVRATAALILPAVRIA